MATNNNTDQQTILDAVGMMPPEAYAQTELEKRQQALLQAQNPSMTVNGTSTVDKVAEQRATPTSVPLGKTGTTPNAPTPITAQTEVGIPTGETITPVQDPNQDKRSKIMEYYRSYFGRDASPEEIDYYDKSGQTLGQIEINITNSETARMIPSARAAWVNTIYQRYLGRPPSSTELKNWVNSGKTYDEMNAEFSSSPLAQQYKDEQKIESASEGYRSEIAKGIPIINQRYERIINEINKAQESGLGAVERQQRGISGQITAGMAAKGITGGSMEQGLQAQAGEAYARGTTNLLGSMSALRSQAAEESLLKEQGIRDLMAQSRLSEVDKVLANRLSSEQWTLEQKIGNENILNSIQDRVINDFKMKLQQLMISLGQYSAVS